MSYSSKTLFALAMIIPSFYAHRIEAAGHAPVQGNIQQVELPDSEGNDFYRAIGKLTGELSCTASFISTHHTQDAPAYLLSNGHCATDPFSPSSANAIVRDKDVVYRVDFNYFHDSKDKTIPITVTSVAYATMKGVDIAVLKTDKTIAELKSMGLEPLTLSSSSAVPGESIVISGIPVAVDALQNSYCTSGVRADVVENYWHWYAMTENGCEGISPGSSGSPVLDSQRQIVGIINTTTAGAIGETCYNGNPCAVGAMGPRVEKDRNYVVPIVGLAACFQKDGVFELSRPGCPLPKSNGIEIVNYPYIFNGENSNVEKQWMFSLARAPDEVRIKKIRLDGPYDSCRDMAGYGAPIKAASFQPADEMLEVAQEGVLQYCILPGESVRADNPDVVQVLIDNTPPTARPDLQFSSRGDLLLIEPIFMTPEYTDYYVAFGPLETFSCENAQYQVYRRIPFRTELAPTRACLYGYDYAENRSGIFEYTFP